MKNKSILLLIFSMSIILVSCHQEKRLPIYGPREVALGKSGENTIDTIYKTIPDFKFYNQDSVLFDQNTFKNKIYIADFFFTSCSTICPIMHRNMLKIYETYKDNNDVMFLSHTIDFKYDVPSKLRNYADKLGVDTKKWVFAFGTKDAIYNIAEKDYLVAVKEDSSAKDGFIHQGWLVLIDKHKRIRGAYDGTNEEDIKKLTNDITILLAEKD